MFRLGFIAVVLLALTAFVVPAAAAPIGFSGYFAPVNWTFNTGGMTDVSVDTTGAPDSITLYGSSNPDQPGGDNYMIQAPADGTISFSYYFAGVPSQFYATFYSMENWNPIWITEWPGTSGTHSYTVTAGEWIGFDVGSSGYYNPYATITNFDFTAAVPEPASVALLGIGVLALGLLRRKRVAA